MEYEFIRELVTLGSDLGNIVLAIGSILGGALFVWRVSKARQRRLDSAYSSTWTNEGDIAPAEPTSHYVELTLTSKDAKITGILRSNGDRLLENLSVNGARSGKSAQISITDIQRAGQIIDYGSANLDLKGDHLHWNLQDQTNPATPALPRRTTLWRAHA